MHQRLPVQENIHSRKGCLVHLTWTTFRLLQYTFGFKTYPFGSLSMDSIKSRMCKGDVATTYTPIDPRLKVLFVLGTQKGGTTFLFRALQRHKAFIGAKHAYMCATHTRYWCRCTYIQIMSVSLLRLILIADYCLHTSRKYGKGCDVCQLAGNHLVCGVKRLTFSTASLHLQETS